VKNPIVYEGTIEVRFGDVDMYGHVNSAKFLDYVTTIRWAYAEKTLGVSSKQLIEKKLGFFMTRSEINYKRSIPPGAVVYICSQIEEVKDTVLLASFKIMSEEKQKTFADGTLHFAVMDLESMRPRALPDWAFPYFFQE